MVIKMARKYIPQIELILARHYQGWKSKKILDELAEKFDKPLSDRQLLRLRTGWKQYETVDSNPLAKQFGWIKD